MSVLWWEISGDYAQALVAAETGERAVELLHAVDGRAYPWERPLVEDVTGDKPAPPSVEGVYAWYGE